MKTSVLTIGIIALTGISVSRAAIIASDDFDSYSNGALPGQTAGGTGFSDTWAYEPSNQEPVTIDAGVVVASSSNGRVNQVFRTLSTPFASSGTLWISYDHGFDADNGGQSWGGLTFFNGTSEIALIGDNFNATTFRVTGNGAADTGISLFGGMKSVVAEITLGAGSGSSINVWINSSGVGAVDVDRAPDATRTGVSFAGVDRLRILGSDTIQRFDNLIIADSVADVNAIPEPSVLLLSGLGSLLLLRRRRY